MHVDYVEAVLDLAEQVPRGRVTTYGAIADALVEQHGGGPRQVGAVMARHGAGVPWWRVVRADGTLPATHADQARQHHLGEGTELRRGGAVDLTVALWLPLLDGTAAD